MRFRWTLILLLLAGMACSGEDASDPTSTSTTPGTTAAATTTAPTGDESIGQPPWGLDVVTMPDSAEAVEAVLAALPDELGGLAPTDGPGRVEGAHEVGYGDAGRAIRATPVASIPWASDEELTPEGD